MHVTCISGRNNLKISFSKFALCTDVFTHFRHVSIVLIHIEVFLDFFIIGGVVSETAKRDRVGRFKHRRVVHQLTGHLTHFIDRLVIVDDDVIAHLVLDGVADVSTCWLRHGFVRCQVFIRAVSTLGQRWRDDNFRPLSESGRRLGLVVLNHFTDEVSEFVCRLVRAQYRTHNL